MGDVDAVVKPYAITLQRDNHERVLTGADFVEVLTLLKGDAHADAVGLDRSNIDAFQQACWDLIAKAEAQAWAVSKTQVNGLRRRIRQLEVEGRRAEAQTLRRQLVMAETFMAAGKQVNLAWDGKRPRGRDAGWVRSRSPAERLQLKRENDMLKELAGTAEGRRLVSALVIEKVTASVDSLEYGLDWMDRVLLDELRGEPVFRSFEESLVKAQQASEASRNDLYAKLRNRTSVKAIRKLNRQLNQSIQASRSGRAVSRGLQVYNLAQELQAYWRCIEAGDWACLGSEIWRRRLPFGSAMEQAYVYDQYMLAAWDCVCTVLPPLALPQAFAGVLLDAMQQAETMYWSESLELLKDELFAAAEFEMTATDRGDDAKAVRCELVAVTYQGKRMAAGDGGSMKDVLYAWVESDWDVDEVLTRTVCSADPVIVAIEEMLRHPALSKKGRQHVHSVRRSDDELAGGGALPGYFQRKEMLKRYFVEQLVEELETRMAAEYMQIAGTYDAQFRRLIHVANELDVRDAMQAAMAAEWDTSMYKELADVWWSLKRHFLLQGQIFDEMTKWTALVVTYSDVYEDVLSTRGQVEREAGLENETYFGLRLLSGAMLTGRAGEDGKLAREWASVPRKAERSMQKRLLDIKKDYVAKARLDTAYDRNRLDEITKLEIWRRAWTSVYKTREELREEALEHTRSLHNDIDDEIERFRRHYAERTATVTVRLRALINGKETTQPVTGARVMLTTKNAVQEVNERLTEVEPGTYEIDVLPGFYAVEAGAPKYKTTAGQDTLKQSVGILYPEGDKRPEPVALTLYLVPPSGALSALVVDADSRQPIRSARVRLTPNPQGDNDFADVEYSGLIVFDDLPPGSDYALEAMADGYKGTAKRTGIVLNPLAPEASTKMPVELALSVILSDVKVRVYDDTGQALEGVTVSLNDQSVLTDRHGRCTLVGIRPCWDVPHTLTASRPGWEPVTQQLMIPPEKAGKTFDVKMVMTSGGRIRVRVIDSETGEAVAQPEISVQTDTVRRQLPGNTDGAAVFTNLSMGYYYVEAFKDGYRAIGDAVEVHVTPEHPEQTVTLRLREGMELRVINREAGTKHEIGGYVQVEGQARRMAPATLHLRAGMHTITCSARGYSEKTLSYLARVDDEGVKTLTVDLTPAMTIVVEVRHNNTLLDDATVTLLKNGNPVGEKTGKAPLFTGLGAGTYTARVDAPGYLAATSDAVNLERLGENRPVNKVIMVALEREKKTGTEGDDAAGKAGTVKEETDDKINPADECGVTELEEVDEEDLEASVAEGESEMEEEERVLAGQVMQDEQVQQGMINTAPFIETWYDFLEREARENKAANVFRAIKIMPRPAKIALQVDSATGRVRGAARMPFLATAIAMGTYGVVAQVYFDAELEGQYDDHTQKASGISRDQAFMEGRVYLGGQEVFRKVNETPVYTSAWTAQGPADDLQGVYRLKKRLDIRKDVPMQFYTSAEIEQVPGAGRKDRALEDYIKDDSENILDQLLGPSRFGGWQGGQRNRFNAILEDERLTVYGQTYNDERRGFNDPVKMREVDGVRDHALGVGGIDNLSNTGFLIYETTSGELWCMLLGLDASPSFGPQKSAARAAIKEHRLITRDYMPGSMDLETHSRAGKVVWRTENGEYDWGWISKTKGWCGRKLSF
jgi:hypothetical protein